MARSEKNSILWRKVRLSLDLGQKEFGEKLGVGAGYISEIESGKKEPSRTLSELFRYIYQESVGETQTLNTNDLEADEMLQKELIEAYRKIVERDERIFELEKQLRLGKPQPSPKKTIKKQIS